MLIYHALRTLFNNLDLQINHASNSQYHVSSDIICRYDHSMLQSKHENKTKTFNRLHHALFFRVP